MASQTRVSNGTINGQSGDIVAVWGKQESWGKRALRVALDTSRWRVSSDQNHVPGSGFAFNSVTCLAFLLSPPNTIIKHIYITKYERENDLRDCLVSGACFSPTTDLTIPDHAGKKSERQHWSSLQLFRGLEQLTLVRGTSSTSSMRRLEPALMILTLYSMPVETLQVCKVDGG